MFSIDYIIQTGGIFLIAAIIFAESGLLVGFFLPGDTLLFGAGLAASQDRLSLPLLIIAVVIAAILGDNLGYSIGRRTGSRIFKKKDGIFFRQEYLERSEKFYENHGGATIILARFTPVVRTFAPVVAGASKMTRQRFFIFNVIGAFIWGVGMTLLGYFIGNRIPGLDKYIEKVILGLFILTIILMLVHMFKDKKTRDLVWRKTKNISSRLMLNKRIN